MTVLRGRVRLVACISSGLHRFDAAMLVPTSIERYRKLHQELERLRENRRRQLRFRRHPKELLQALEDLADQTTLPPWFF